MAYNLFEIPTLLDAELPWDMRNVCEDVTPKGSGDDADRWMGGVTWRTNRTSAPGIWDPVNGVEFGTSTTEKNISDYCSSLDAVAESDARVMYLPYFCPMSGPPDDKDIALAKARLDVVTSVGMERVFWQMAHDLGVEYNTGTAAPTEGLLSGMMDFAVNAMPAQPTQLMFHMPGLVADPYLAQIGRDPSNEVAPMTQRGDKIVIGTGYGNLTGGASNVEIVCTGPVGYLLGPIEINESAAFVVTENRRVLVAERAFTIQTDWDRVQFGKSTLA